MRFLKKYYIVYIFALAAAVCAAQLLSRAALARVQAVAAPVQKTLIIDPGHGGEDGGAVSCTGLTESSFNLEISLRLHELCIFAGIPTKIIRTTDEAIYSEGCKTISEKKISDLHNRVALVQATPNAVLVSIHQNTFSDGQYHGAQVFYAETPGSQAFAERVQGLLAEVDPDNHRKCKPCTAVYLMKNISCTGILVECGFLSNPAEEQRLRMPEYQKKLVCAVFSGIRQEFGKEHEENEI